MKLFRLGFVSPEFSQAVYHILAREGIESLIVLSPASRYVCAGYFQDVKRCVDLDYCRANAIPVLRREVGGGVVLLDSGQVFYQLVLKRDNPMLPATVAAMYERFSVPPVETYRALGVPARHRPVNDIVTESGKKISGQGGADIGPSQVFVGNIILDFDYETMVRALRVPDEKFRDKVYRTMKDNLTTLKNELGSEPDRSTVEEILIEKFEDLLGPLEASELPRELLPRIAEFGKWLSSDEFVFGGPSRKPEPVKVKEGLYIGHADFKAQGGLISVDVEVERGTIKDIAIHGDFTLRPKDEFPFVAEILVGRPVDRSEIVSAVEKVYEERRLDSPGVTPDDIATAVLKACGKE